MAVVAAETLVGRGIAHTERWETAVGWGWRWRSHGVSTEEISDDPVIRGGRDRGAVVGGGRRSEAPPTDSGEGGRAREARWPRRWEISWTGGAAAELARQGRG